MKRPWHSPSPEIIESLSRIVFSVLRRHATYPEHIKLPALAKLLLAEPNWTLTTSNSGSRIRMLVHHLREKSYPVGADRQGYFVATEYSQLMDTIRTLMSREASIERAVKGLIGATFEEIKQ